MTWHYLAGVNNGSILKSAKYDPSEGELDLGIRDRADLERLSQGFALKYVLAVMNSSFARQYLQVRRRSNLHLFPDDWKPLPIPKIPLAEQRDIVNLVDEILQLYSNHNYPLREDSLLRLHALESEINRYVEALYEQAAARVDRAASAASESGKSNVRSPSAAETAALGARSGDAGDAGEMDDDDEEALV